VSTQIYRRNQRLDDLSQLEISLERRSKASIRENQILHWESIAAEYSTASVQAIADVSQALDLLSEVAERVGEVCWQPDRRTPMSDQVMSLRETARTALNLIKEFRSMNTAIAADAITSKPLTIAWGIWESDPTLENGGRWLKWYAGMPIRDANAFLPLVAFEDAGKAGFYAAEFADDIEASTGTRPRVRVASLMLPSRQAAEAAKAAHEANQTTHAVAG
jgi:hypothetical protein